LQHIVDHLPDLRRVTQHRGQGGVEFEADAQRRTFVQVQHFADQGVEIERGEPGRGQARIVAEGIDEVLHRLDLIDDRGRGAREHFAPAVVEAVGEFQRQALGRKLDRRQRVLDLVRQAAGDFAPRRRALRRDQAGDVVEHHHQAAAGGGRQARAVDRAGSAASCP